MIKFSLPFVALAIAIAAMKRFGGGGWPLGEADLTLVAASVSFLVCGSIVRAFSWRKLFPEKERPDTNIILLGVGASGASSPFLPARLDCAVKVALINRLSPKTRITTLGVSLASLALAEFASMLPFTLCAALLTHNLMFQIIAGAVALLNFGAVMLMLKGKWLAGKLKRHVRGRFQEGAEALAVRVADSGEAKAALYGFTGCWCLRAASAYTLMYALGVPSPIYVIFLYLALGSLSCSLPISPGGAAMAIGAGTALLVGCGISGKIATSYAASTTVVGFSAAITTFGIAIISISLSSLIQKGSLRVSLTAPVSD